MYKCLLTCLILSLPCVFTVADDRVPADAVPQLLQDVKVVDPQALVSEKWAEFLPVSREKLLELLWHRMQSESRPQSTIDRVKYSARLSGQTLVDGEISIRLSEDAAQSQIVLGQTNLGQLKLYDGNIQVPLAAIAGRGLVPLLESGVKQLSGSWSVTGVRRGRLVIFDLVLPAAEVSSLQVTTDSSTQLTSPNALLRPIDSGPEEIVWDVFPSNPAMLTLESQQAGDGQNEVVFVAVGADVTILQDEADVTWSVVVPRSLAGSVLRFEIRGDVVPSSPVLSGSDVDFEIVFAGARRFIEVTLPEAASGVLSLDGRFAPTTAGLFQVPFLRPEIYRKVDGRQQKLRLQSSIVRAEIDSQSVVKRLELSGLSRNDVSFSDSGNQILELEQYSAEASATIQVARSLPLVQDEVIVQTESNGSGIQATAFVRASARSGTVTKLRWDIPVNWRVTDVREFDTGNAPLLYRIRESDSNRFNQVEVTLRTPLISRSTYQGLIVQMQSVDSSLALQQPATLVSPDYQRRHDLVLMSATAAERLVNSWTNEPISRPELSQLVPWVPVDAEDLVAYRRTQLKLADNVSVGRAEVLATVDYSLESIGRRVRETASIRLNSEEELPARIPISLSSEVAAEVSLDSSNVRLIRADQTSDSEWVIELDREFQVSREVEFTLTTTRRMQSRLAGLVVGFDSCRQTGRIVPPTDKDRLILAIESREARSIVDSAVEYPSEPFTLMIEGIAREATGREVSGRGFLLANRQQLSGLARLLVTPAGANDLLRVKVPTDDVRVFINGNEAYTQSQNQELQIALPDAATPAELDIYFRIDSKAKTSLDVPVFEFARVRQDVSWFILNSDSVSVVMASQQGVSKCSPTAIAEMIGGQSQSPDYRTLADYTANWMLAAKMKNHCTVVSNPEVPHVIQFFQAPRSNQIGWLCFWATLTAVLWQLSGIVNARRIGLVLLLILCVSYLVSEKYTLLNGALAGSLLFFGVRCLSKVLHRLLIAVPNIVSRKSVRFLIVLSVVSSGASYAQSPSDSQIIAIGDKVESSFLYIKRSFHDSLSQSFKNQASTQIAVLETQLTISLESSAAAIATIRTKVAVPGQETPKLMLPLGAATLVECRLNDKVVFPRRDSSGKTMIEVSSDAQVPEKRLGDQSAAVAIGPRNFGDWRLSTVEYDVRLSLRSLNAVSRLSLEFPRSPVTTIKLQDPQKTIVDAKLRRSGSQQISKTPAGKFRFPVLSNIGEIEINLVLRGTEPQVGDTVNSAEVVCALEALPDRLVSKTAYQFTAVDSQFEELVLKILPETITSVKSELGRPIQWTVVEGGIAVAVDSDSSRQQTVIVAQEVDTELSLTKTLDVQELRIMNGERAAEFRLIVSTADQFIVDRIFSGEDQLASLPASNGLDPQMVRATERQVLVPQEVETVGIDITERISTQTVDVFQSVVVRDDAINWTCRCVSEISGQPSFRQVVFLSPGVRVESVAATLSGTDRLQAWSRTKDAVVISLREATRGNLTVELSGSIPRVIGKRTELPLVGFHADVQALQSSVEISSESQNATFVDDFGGVIADDPFDKETVLPPTPIRLSVVDDSLPMVIRESQPQSVDARVATLVYDDSGQTRVATVMELSVQDISAPLRFRTRNTEIDSQLPIVYQDGEVVGASEAAGVFTIPSPSFSIDRKCVLVLPNVVPLIRSESLSVLIPDFDAVTTVSASVCYDFRQNTDAVFQNVELPGWLENVISDLPLPQNSSPRISTATFAPDSRKIQIRLPGKQKNSVTDSIAADVQYVDCEHLLQTESDGITGTTSLLVFATQSRSAFAVSVPEQMVIGRVTVNGQSTQIKRSGVSLSVTLPSKISHVLIDWIGAMPVGYGAGSYQVSVPGTLQTSGRHRIRVKPPGDKSRWWKTGASAELPETFTESRLASIVTGLQLLDLDDASTLNQTEATPKSSLPLALFSQLSAQSADAATGVDQFVSFAEQDACILLLTDQPQLQISDLVFPSAFFCGALLLSVALVISPWFGVFKRASTKASAEAETVVSQTSSTGEPATVIGLQQDSTAR